MALVAAGGSDSTAAADDPGLVTLNAVQETVIGAQTAEVRRGPLTRRLRVSGVIDDDDTRHRILAARVPGRIERLPGPGDPARAGGGPGGGGAGGARRG